MAEPFNVEQFRQQMSGQVPQGQHQWQSPMPVQVPPQMVQAQPSPQPYQPQPYPPQAMPQNQGQAQPYQPQPYAVPPVQQPYVPPQQAYAPQMQPQTPIHQMPPQAVFAPPPGHHAVPDTEEAPKKSRFKLKRAAKEKAPKVKKAKKEKAEASHTTNTSPAIIFMFGMATGIVCFLVGNMAMSALLSDTSAKDFRTIEQNAMKTQQPKLPTSEPKTESLAEVTTP